MNCEQPKEMLVVTLGKKIIAITPVRILRIFAAVFLCVGCGAPGGDNAFSGFANGFNAGRQQQPTQAASSSEPEHFCSIDFDCAIGAICLKAASYSASGHCVRGSR